jgi:hypothetical protein
MVLSKGIVFLCLIAVVFFILYTSSSNQTRILPGSANAPAGITIFAPMPGAPPLQSFLPVQEQKREGFTVKFGKRTVPQTPLTPVQSVEVQTDCVPPPPPPQQVESVDISYSHGVGSYQETVASQAQVVNNLSGIRISSFNPLMII